MLEMQEAGNKGHEKRVCMGCSDGNVTLTDI